MSGSQKWPAEIPLTSLYTAGPAGQKFLEALKARGAIMACPCKECGDVYVPARTFCERCFERLNTQVAVGPGGTLRSFASATEDRDGHRLREPQMWALVQLDGATTVMLHRLIGVRDTSEIAIGNRVEAVIKTKARRSGSILDIEGFRPASAPRQPAGSRAPKDRRGPRRGTRRG